MLYNDRQTGEVKELSTPIPLYHGTTSNLNPGDIVEPRLGSDKLPKEQVAYAAMEKSYAVRHAVSRSEGEKKLGVGRQPRVYRVEPLPGTVHDLDENKSRDNQQPNVISPKGFKVVEEDKDNKGGWFHPIWRE